MLYDALSAVFAYGIGLWVRFDFNYSGIPAGLMNAFLHFIPIYRGVNSNQYHLPPVSLYMAVCKL